jgi:two-component sensor histidine kinase
VTHYQKNQLQEAKDSIETAVSQNVSHLEAQKGELSLKDDSIRNKNESLRLIESKNDSLESETKRKQNELIDAENKKDVFFALALLASLLAVFFYARESRRTKRGKAKVERINTELHENNQQLETLNNVLRDKSQQLETLIRELHHRTKNNLQEISSMLYLQASDMEESNRPLAKVVP